MKIGGLTWWRYNYGSILQAYALQNELQERQIDYEIVCQYGKKTASVSNLKEKIKRLGIRKTIKRVIWKFGLKKLRRRNTNIQNFVDKYLKVSDKEYNDYNIYEANSQYDGFVCGSDQIWNPKLTSLNSIYWLRFADKDKIKIAYAPSVGVNCLSDDQKKNIKENLNDFKAISTREESSTKLINKAIGTEKCITVLDPTLLVERDLWDELATSENKYDESYVFVYMLRGTKKQRKLIADYAKSKGLKIITMPFLDNEKISLYDFKFGDIKIWDASPIDFINLIKYAEFVFTDSFHCMLFSTMYHVNFYTFPKIGKAQVNRMTAFQKLINANNRMLNSDIKLQDIDKIPTIDWKYVDDIIRIKRKESKEFLDKSFDII